MRKGYEKGLRTCRHYFICCPKPLHYGSSCTISSKKQHDASKAKTELEEIAVQWYTEELQKPEKERQGARKICEEEMIEYENETGKSIHLNHSTII